MTRDPLAAIIDHTLLKPEATRADVEATIAEGAALETYSVCLSPSVLPVTLPEGLKLAVVVGFPSGKHHSEIKAAEAALAAAQGADEAAVEKARSAFDSPVIVAVVSAPVDSPKIPQWEQFLASGAVCLELVNAALAAGYGAAWLTGPATQPEFARAHLGVKDGEKVVGLIHIGRRGPTPPDRPRPDIAAKTTFLA